MRKRLLTGIIMVISLFTFGFFQSHVFASTQHVYDYANLLTSTEVKQLENLAAELGAERETDFIILTTDNTDGKDVVQYMEDFYDDMAPGYDKPHGNTAILTVDMEHRDVYLAGFYKAKEYLDDSRLESIREKITPDLTEGNYYDAFASFMELSHDYMGYPPGVNPNNIFFQWWFQIGVSLIIAAGVVGMMLYNSGGKVTVNERTYLNSKASKINQQRDQYIRKTVTKHKRPSSNNGGGGGVTGGGHSHSGSRGSF
ncbi:TPM domain-containing protein [Caldibacillus lycopersici]|uniref:TPM domain-containing protein n=1 Tax=Perspicuibacillus lycopersici TaxID=1325689 RepID=A0AAE3IVE1_9BACI|nr:TPM domain-containing protein [Perspicuibacillus lycopersici]MCU9615335.1 TPM domain-containing protein [Perspicuibacillus lycopersici]